MSKSDGRRIFACLLAALVVILGSGRAEAELIISQTTVQPTGDPSVILDFQLALGVGTHLSNGNTIELFNVPDVVTSPPPFGPAYVYISGVGSPTTAGMTSTVSDYHADREWPYAYFRHHIDV